MWHEIPNIFVQKVSAVNPQIIQLDPLYNDPLSTHVPSPGCDTFFGLSYPYVTIAIHLQKHFRNCNFWGKKYCKRTSSGQLEARNVWCNWTSSQLFPGAHRNLPNKNSFPPSNLRSPKPCSHHHRDRHSPPLAGSPSHPLESIRMDQLTATVVETSSHFRKPPEAKAGSLGFHRVFCQEKYGEEKGSCFKRDPFVRGLKIGESSLNDI